MHGSRSAAKDWRFFWLLQTPGLFTHAHSQNLLKGAPQKSSQTYTIQRLASDSLVNLVYLSYTSHSSGQSRRGRGRGRSQRSGLAVKSAPTSHTGSHAKATDSPLDYRSIYKSPSSLLACNKKNTPLLIPRHAMHRAPLSNMPPKKPFPKNR